ncbi:MAG: FAD-dependent oxidoreductase, partial [Pikeienuella sp.]
MRIRRLPKDDATNGWSRILPPRTANPALIGDRDFDWVVLGGGYAGLAAARRLAETRPNDTIAVIEAGAVGENASGRNSGFAIDLPHNVGSSMEELEGSHRYMRLARMSIDQLDQVVRAKGIACDWARDGKYHAAVSAKGARDVLEPFAKELDALDEPYERVEREELTARLGSNHFHSA